MSRYEQRLAKAIQFGGGGVETWVQKLRLASYQARRGELDRARETVSAAREVFGMGVSAAATVHINLTEAVCEFYEHGIEAAIAKLARARVLSIACPPNDDAPAMIAAWFAGIHRYRANWVSMRLEILRAVEEPERISQDVCCRLGLVLGDANLESGCARRADHWYQFARRWATELGDDATTGASIHNRAAFNIFNSRLALIENLHVNVDIRALKTEAASASNFGSFYRDQAFAWSLQLLQGQVHLLERRYQEALKLLSAEGEDDSWTMEWPAANLVRLADILLCRTMIENTDVRFLEAYCENLRRAHFDSVGPGDRAIAASAIAMALEYAKSDVYEIYKNMATEALAEYQACQRHENSVLDDLDPLIATSALQKWL